MDYGIIFQQFIVAEKYKWYFSRVNDICDTVIYGGFENNGWCDASSKLVEMLSKEMVLRQNCKWTEKSFQDVRKLLCRYATASELMDALSAAYLVFLSKNKIILFLVRPEDELSLVEQDIYDAFEKHDISESIFLELTGQTRYQCSEELMNLWRKHQYVLDTWYRKMIIRTAMGILCDAKECDDEGTVQVLLSFLQEVQDQVERDGITEMLACIYQDDFANIKDVYLLNPENLVLNLMYDWIIKINSIT